MSELQMKKLSKSQFFFFTLHAQLGLAILTLPHIVGARAGHDGWISVLIAGIAVQILALLYYLIVKNYPNKTFYDIVVDLLGTKVGKLINFILIGYYVLYATLIAQKCTSILNLWIYYRTPPWVIMGLFIFVCFYIVTSDIQIIGRFLVLASFFIIMLVLLITWTIKDLHPLFLLPVGEAGIEDILKGAFDATIAFAGFEIFLFIHAFTDGTVKAKLKWEQISILVVGLFYLLTTLICFMYFPNAAKNIEHPIVYLLVPTKFTIVERVEVFFLAGWVVIMATTYMCFLYISCLGISKLRKRNHHKKEVKIVSIITFVIALPSLYINKPTFWHTVEVIQQYYTYITILFIPLLVASIILFKGKKVKQDEG